MIGGERVINMSGRFMLMMLPCKDMSREARMFRAHTWGLL